MTTACATCEMFVDADTQDRHSGGECRRFPPMNLHPNAKRAFPQVAETDWCGEHQDFRTITIAKDDVQAKQDALDALSSPPKGGPGPGPSADLLPKVDIGGAGAAAGTADTTDTESKPGAES